MGQPITDITIVGGGTAGWIVAAYLNHRLQWGLTARAGMRITVIESPNVPTVGVGEATVPTLKGTLKVLQISEDEFVARTDATMKLGIRFDNWQKPRADGSMHSYVNPFSGSRPVGGTSPAHAFLAHESDGGFYAATGVAVAAAEGLKAPRGVEGAAFSGPLQYAYHVDAAKLASFLKGVCITRGVEYVSDDLLGIVQDENGFITALTLKERGDWPTQLVIDCTGFRGLIINEMLGEPFDSLGEYLFDDRAIPIQVERARRDAIEPVTVSHALNSGWSWRIPLHHRDGTGYVYSSRFVSDDDALAELETLLGPAARLTDPRTIRMRVGQTRRSWVKNCVAIGSSSGFLEPLESTTILAIELASRWLLRNLPTTDFEPPLAARFNRELDQFYDEVRDFIGLHFALSDRDDTPYWRAVRNEAKRSDTLVENLDLWRHRLPNREDLRGDAVFGHVAIQGVLIGKGFYDRLPSAGIDAVSAETWQRHRQEIRAQQHVLGVALPDHFAFLEAIRARAVMGESSTRKPGADSVDEEAILAATQLLREA